MICPLTRPHPCKSEPTCAVGVSIASPDALERVSFHLDIFNFGVRPYHIGQLLHVIVDNHQLAHVFEEMNHSCWDFHYFVASQVQSLKSFETRAAKHFYTGDSIHVQVQLLEGMNMHQPTRDFGDLISVEIHICQAFKLHVTR